MDHRQPGDHADTNEEDERTRPLLERLRALKVKLPGSGPGSRDFKLFLQKLIISTLAC